MLGGIDPIIIFQFSKLKKTKWADFLSKIPIISEIPTLLEQPPIPIYLSEKITGLYIESEDKNVDIETDTDTLTDGETPEVNQKGINSSVTINLVALKNSIGLSILSSSIDLIYEKVTSKEYAITYLNGPTTIFRGRLSGFSVNQNANNDLMNIRIELTRGFKQPQAPKEIGITVPSFQGIIPGG